MPSMGYITTGQNLMPDIYSGAQLGMQLFEQADAIRREQGIRSFYGAQAGLDPDTTAQAPIPELANLYHEQQARQTWAPQAFIDRPGMGPGAMGPPSPEDAAAYQIALKSAPPELLKAQALQIQHDQKQQRDQAAHQALFDQHMQSYKAAIFDEVKQGQMSVTRAQDLIRNELARMSGGGNLPAAAFSPQAQANADPNKLGRDHLAMRIHTGVQLLSQAQAERDRLNQLYLKEGDPSILVAINQQDAEIKSINNQIMALTGQHAELLPRGSLIPGGLPNPGGAPAGGMGTPPAVTPGPAGQDTVAQMMEFAHQKAVEQNPGADPQAIEDAAVAILEQLVAGSGNER